jgi:hypothetical protein
MEQRLRRIAGYTLILFGVVALAAASRALIS